MENERVAVLETKVDAILEELRGLKEDVHALTAVYRTGKYLLGMSAGFMGWVNWDAISMFFHPPKH